MLPKAFTADLGFTGSIVDVVRKARVTAVCAETCRSAFECLTFEVGLDFRTFVPRVTAHFVTWNLISPQGRRADSDLNAQLSQAEVGFIRGFGFRSRNGIPSSIEKAYGIFNTVAG